MHIGVGVFAMERWAGLKAPWKPFGSLSGPANPKHTSATILLGSG